MNISQHINEWSKKILKEAIEEGYDPSKDEFEQSDELKGADDYEAAQEYEKWMKDREKIMKELAPKSTNEGCCDEKEEASDAESVPEDGEGGDKKPEAPAEDPDAEKKSTDGEDQEQIDEGLWGNLKRAWSDFWTKDIFKDKKQWNQVFDQLKGSAKDSLSKLAEALNAAVEDNKKDSLIKVNLDGKEKYLGNGTIMDYKGQYLVFSIVAKKDMAATPSAVGGMMKEKHLQNFSKVNGLLVIQVGNGDEEEEKSEKETVMSGMPLKSAKYENGVIVVEVGKALDDQKDDIDLKGMFTV